MADSITDGTHQMTPPVINVSRTTNHKNDFADTIIYQVFATLNGVSTQIFETDNKDKAQQFVNVINGNTFLTKLQATIKTKYVNHAVIEDGYYTYSHIYENGQTINFTIYNSPITYNTADVINGWMGYVLKFTSQVSHWWFTKYAYADSLDGVDNFSTTYPTDHTPKFIGIEVSPIGYKHDTPKWYKWQPFNEGMSTNEMHTVFDYKVEITDEVEQINQTAPINKRNIRNDNWKYAPNEQYPFIGGYES